MGQLAQLENQTATGRLEEGQAKLAWPAGGPLAMMEVADRGTGDPNAGSPGRRQKSTVYPTMALRMRSFF